MPPGARAVLFILVRRSEFTIKVTCYRRAWRKSPSVTLILDFCRDLERVLPYLSQLILWNLCGRVPHQTRRRIGRDDGSFSLMLGGAPNPGLGAVCRRRAFIASSKATARSRDQIEASKIGAQTACVRKP